MSLKVTTQIVSLFIASAFLVSCSSNAKKTTATTTTTASSASTKDVKKANTTTKTKTTTTSVATGVLVCKSGTDARTLEVVAKDGGCELTYTKFDQTTTPATSGNGTAHCETVKAKIQGNLENSGFKCE